MEVQLIVLALCITLTLAVDGNNIFDLIKLNNIVGIRELLARDPQVLNQRGPGGQTPLMNAVLSGQLSAVSALLEAGADVTIGEKDGYTPMHGAGFQGRAEIAQVLIDHGIPFDERHSDGYLPMHRACWGTEKRHADTVEVFLKAGVAVDEPAADGRDCAGMTKSKRTKKVLKKYRHKAEL